MLRAIVWFELRQYLRSISTYVYFFLLGAVAFLAMAASAGAFSNISVSAGGGKVLANSPYLLAGLISALGYIGMLVISAITGRAAFQDFETRTHSLFFTAPISKTAYLGGRFIASILILTGIFSSIAIGMALGTLMPFVDKTLLGPNRFVAYVQPYLASVLPNMLLMGALFFSLAALSRRILPVYMTSVILLMGYLIASVVTSKIEYKTAAAMLDPFGQSAMDRITEYWTISEKNSRIVSLEGLFLWNRLLWTGVAAALLGFTFYRFKFVYALEGRRWRKSRAANTDHPASLRSHPSSRGGEFLVQGSPPREEGCERSDAGWSGFAAQFYLRALGRLSYFGFKETVKNVYFAVIVLAGILYVAAASRVAGSIFGTPTYPVTYQVLTVTGGVFSLFILIIITFYSGELVWRDRDSRTHELIDVLPLPGWVLFLSQLLALFWVQVLLMFVVMAAGIGIQLSQGYTRLELGLYLKSLFGIHLLDYWLLCVLAITVQTLVNNKYLGHFVMVLYYLADTFRDRFGLEHDLYGYGGNPGYTYSDMNGFGHFLGPVYWFDAYWAAFAVLLALVAYLFSMRGLASGARWRTRLAWQRYQSRQQWIALAGAIAFVGLGGFILYNTTVLNVFRTSKQQERLTVRYENEYKKYRGMPQPRITAVRFTADVYPDALSVRIQGHYDIANKTPQPIDTILVEVPEVWNERRLRFTPAATLQAEERALDVAIYRVDPPIAPGATGSLDFDLSYSPHGFHNGEGPTFVVYNGTFFNSGMLPHFGYEDSRELAEDSARRSYGLHEKERMADLNDIEARRNTYISSDSDWVSFEATISTSADQIAVAPGDLVKEWSEGNRRYYQYRSRSDVLDFFSVLSARYQVMRDRWNDVDLAIYYHPGHEYDLAKMMAGMKAALDYCTSNFGPYPHKTLRIVEFPRFESFAQSFPASIPYSEAIGFIARVDPKSEEDVDYPFYVTAHEVAHQWWAHQAIGGNVQGATLMSESLSQYTALMVMKHEVGPEQMKRFLKYEMDRYLGGRSIERKKELPLERVENQPYIHYQKASVVFYALQDYLGEENLNRALREYLQAVARQGPPYTNSVELIDRLRKIVPKDLTYIIEDMFESITLYENRALAATYRKTENGKYEVKLKVAAKKLKAGQLGEEKESPIADWIDIGVLDSKGKPLYMTKHKIEQNETEFTILVDGVPAKAGIDPWNKLIDRKPDDNTITVTKL